MSTEKLAADNTSTFWETQWSVGKTGWKAFEASDCPFHGNLFRGLKAVGWIEEGAAPTSSAEQRAAVVAAVERAIVLRAKGGEGPVGLNCFAPLCGDSGIIRYLYDVVVDAVINVRKTLPEGSSVSCVISGVDLAPVAIEALVKAYFTESRFSVKDSCVDNLRELAVTGDTEGVSVRLFVGDLFDAAVALEGSVDFVYDHASMMAMHPSLRVRYVEEGIKRTLRFTNQTVSPMLSPVLYLTQVMRPPAIRSEGPPFHVPVASLTETFYTPSQGWRRFEIDNVDGIEALSDEEFAKRLPLSSLMATPGLGFVQHAFAFVGSA